MKQDRSIGRHVGALVMMLAGAGGGALAADIMKLEDGAQVERLAVSDTGATRVTATGGGAALTVTQQGGGDALLLQGGGLKVGDGTTAAGIVIDDATAGASPLITQAASQSVFGGPTTSADAWHTHAAIGGGGIKQIQAGTVSMSSGQTVTVNLGQAVDWSKTFVVLGGGPVAGYRYAIGSGYSYRVVGYAVAAAQPYVSSRPSPTQLRITASPGAPGGWSGGGGNPSGVSWQVIEFN